MTYIVNDNCIKCKLMDCVEVCPVDCFYEGENMLVIHPDECIDCGVCEPECPVEAIVPDNVSRRKGETKNAYEARNFSSGFGSAARVVSISRNPKTSRKKKAPIGPQRIATDKIFNSHCITIIVKYH